MDAASQLIDSYLNTRFEVDGKFTLRPRIKSLDLLNIYADKGVESAACITAFNPSSKMFSDAENLDFHSKLVSDAELSRMQFLPMLGKCPCNDWPAEKGLLLLGLDLSQAKRVAAKFNQNAILFAGKDCVPQIYIVDRTLGFASKP